MRNSIFSYSGIWCWTSHTLSQDQLDQNWSSVANIMPFCRYFITLSEVDINWWLPWKFQKGPKRVATSPNLVPKGINFDWCFFRKVPNSTDPTWNGDLNFSKWGQQWSAFGWLPLSPLVSLCHLLPDTPSVLIVLSIHIFFTFKLPLMKNFLTSTPLPPLSRPT